MRDGVSTRRIICSFPSCTVGPTSVPKALLTQTAAKVYLHTSASMAASTLVTLLLLTIPGVVKALPFRDLPRDLSYPLVEAPSTMFSSIAGSPYFTVWPVANLSYDAATGDIASGTYGTAPPGELDDLEPWKNQRSVLSLMNRCGYAPN